MVSTGVWLVLAGSTGLVLWRAARVRWARFAEAAARARLLAPDAEGFSYIVSYYENPEALLLQARTWARYDPRFLEMLEFIVVDDGSRARPARAHVDDLRAVFADLPVAWKLIELERDIGYNSGGARNVGIHASTKDVLLLIDIDTLVPPHRLELFVRAARRLAHDEMVRNFIAVWPADARDGIPHANSILVRRSTLEAHGWFNEDFSGCYGAEDLEFARRLEFRGVVSLPERGPRLPWLVDTRVGITSLRMDEASRAAQITHNERRLFALADRGYPMPTRPLRVPFRFVAGSAPQ